MYRDIIDIIVYCGYIILNTIDINKYIGKILYFIKILGSLSGDLAFNHCCYILIF